jgi:HD-like signal output (HDOD) protein
MSNSANDATYAAYLTTMNTYVANRNSVMSQMRALLNNAEQGTSFDTTNVASLVAQAKALTKQMVKLGNSAAH